MGNDPVNIIDPKGESGIYYARRLTSQISSYRANPYNSSFYWTERQASSYLSGAKRQASDYFGAVSRTATVAGIGCAAAGVCSPVLPAIAIAGTASGFAEAALGDNPVRDIAMEVVTGQIGDKVKVGAEIAKLISKGVGDNLVDASAEGATMAVNGFIKRLAENTGENNSKPSDRGMSSGNVQICSGMGAQKGGC